MWLLHEYVNIYTMFATEYLVPDPQGEAKKNKLELGWGKTTKLSLFPQKGVLNRKSHIGMLQFKVANDQWKEHSQCIELEHRDVKAAWKQKLTESQHLVQRYRSEGERRQNDVDNLLVAAKEKLVSEQVSGWLLGANHASCNCEPVMEILTGSWPPSNGASTWQLFTWFVTGCQSWVLWQPVTWLVTGIQSHNWQLVTWFVAGIQSHNWQPVTWLVTSNHVTGS